jgi:hypothetical protein
MKGLHAFYILLLTTFGLSACSTNQTIEDKMPQLQPGQGLAAVVIDTGDDISQVSMIPITGTGQALLIPSVPAGEHLYLFVAEAGTYCMHHFNTKRTSFGARANDQCFDVEPGKISYGGVYIPFVGFNFYVQAFGAMSQDDDWKNFWQLLKSTYPNIAASAFATPETIAKESAPPPASPSTGICKLLNVGDASALLGAKTDDGVENSELIPACTYTHDEQQVVRVSLLKQASMDSKSMDDLTPKTNYGWSKASPVPEVGDEALFFSRGSTSQLYVLKTHQFILILTVEGVQRPDLQSAMGQAAKTALSRL